MPNLFIYFTENHTYLFIYLFEFLVIITYAKILEQMNHTYWLDFGTLLGAHRCNDVLAHDGKFSFTLFRFHVVTVVQKY